MKKLKCFVCAILFIIPVFGQQLTVSYHSGENYFPIVNGSHAVIINTDSGDYKVVQIAARALQDDIYQVSSQRPKISHGDLQEDFPVIAGTIGHSRFIDELIRQNKISAKNITGKWETFSISILDHPFKHVKQALVIVGSDRRGTAFGVFELSRLLGVSPWSWWSDVHAEKHSSIFIKHGTEIQGPPSVKYRGIFINDEDWGMQPWAAKNTDTLVKDIGPNTYAKVFELLLRLKANYIWPAMHPCTRAFYYYKDNPRLADDYAIVVGTSHCEPMLRNNVFEWAENFENEYGKKPGDWRYDLNQQQIYQYWKDRIDQTKSFESVYTVGMRGIHDGSMPGPKAMPEKVKLLNRIIKDQRGLLQTDLNKEDLPQIFCPYKEILDVYRNGVQLPDDVTIVWSDDNHGYIRQLSNEAEQHRKGHSGIYYHLSYWGSPQDYLWLSSVSPSLISYEMTKAFDYGADRLWVFNVGDLKPAEMEINFAMDLAWDIKQWRPAKAQQYVKQWAAQTFGQNLSEDISFIKSIYYRLAAEGKPEHLGLISFSDQQQKRRLEQYQLIAEKAEQLYAHVPLHLKDAFFELIYYPVMSAGLMNEKIFFAKMSLDNARRSPDSALYYSNKSTEAYTRIINLTDEYNHSIANGKWNGIMSWHPRDLPVFFLPKMANQKYLDSVRRIPEYKNQAPGTKQMVIKAADYSSKKELAGIRFQVINGLGITGNGVSTFPLKRRSIPETPTARLPYLEYRIPLDKGDHVIQIKCLPTQSIDSDGKLFYAISVNDEKPQFVNIHAESETAQWKQNVLRGFAEGKSVHRILQSGEVLLRIYFPDPGLVINEITID